MMVIWQDKNRIELFTNSILHIIIATIFLILFLSSFRCQVIQPVCVISKSECDEWSNRRQLHVVESPMNILILICIFLCILFSVIVFWCHCHSHPHVVRLQVDIVFHPTMFVAHVTSIFSTFIIHFESNPIQCIVICIAHVVTCTSAYAYAFESIPTKNFRILWRR